MVLLDSVDGAAMLRSVEQRQREVAPAAADNSAAPGGSLGGASGGAGCAASGRCAEDKGCVEGCCVAASDAASVSGRCLERLLHSYQRQINGSFCAFASAAMAIKYTWGVDVAQQTLCDDFYLGPAASTEDRRRLRRYGVSLESLAAMLGRYIATTRHKRGASVAVDAHHYVDEAEDDLRNALLETYGSDCRSTGAVIANLHREAFGHRGGHFTMCGPLVSSGDGVEHVLLLDPSLRTAPHWLPLRYLASRIATFDRTARANRGFLVVSSGASGSTDGRAKSPATSTGGCSRGSTAFKSGY